MGRNLLHPNAEISNISDTLVNGDTVEIRDLKEYFEKCPNQNSTRVKPKITGDLQEMTSSFGVESIFFDDSNEFSALILQKFAGRHLVMPKAILKTRDIVEFVRKWISNEAYQNLETVVIGMYDETSEVRRREAEGNLPLIGYDPLVRPPKYNYDPKIIDYGRGQIDIGGYTFYDVVRDGDAKKASLKINGVEFIFLINIFHNSADYGSAHTLIRHQNDFFGRLRPELRNQLKEIDNIRNGITEPEAETNGSSSNSGENKKKAQENTIKCQTSEKELEVEPEEKVQAAGDKIKCETSEKESEVEQKKKLQAAVDKRLKTLKYELKKVEPKFVKFVQKIINESIQTVFAFTETGFAICFRRNFEDNHFWRMVCSDGIRYSDFEPNEDPKLITIYKCAGLALKIVGKKNCIKYWYDCEDQSVKKTNNILEKEGTFVEINKDVIDRENEIFLRLFRESLPNYEGDDEMLKSDSMKLLNNLSSSSSLDTSDENLNQSNKMKIKRKKKDKRKGKTSVKQENEDLTTHPPPIQKPVKKVYKGPKPLPTQPTRDTSVLPLDVNNNKNLQELQSDKSSTEFWNVPSRKTSVTSQKSSISTLSSSSTNKPVRRRDRTRRNTIKAVENSFSSAV
ncbi:hypothetical protein CRE_08121 [Caenorhabditis remanei]|uniref:F-box associated domain-containing protein n=1 Tax=Caenorhabditis remanei TaxID=31234 RepID=E3M3I3_CAERE|nr:hypothetical protein CRE_08121 [Caenorhabditis remanei]